MLKLLQVIVLFSLILTLGSEGKSVFDSKIFSYENPQEAKGLRISLQGKGWKAREVQLSDASFYSEIISDSKSVRRDGLWSREIGGLILAWVESLERGHPRAALTFSDSITDEKIGYIEVCLGSRQGAAELDYCFIPRAWKMYAENIFQTMINQWAPEINRIGCGVGLCDEQKNIQEAFQCFTGEALGYFLDNKQTYSMCKTSLQYVSMFMPLASLSGWRFDGHSFYPAPVSAKNRKIFIDFSTKEICTNDILEQESIKKFLETGLIPGAWYRLIDPTKCIRTVSLHPVNDRIYYHFGEWLPLESNIFSYSNVMDAQDLRVCLRGVGWTARQVDRSDTSFYTLMTANPNTVRGLSARTNLSSKGWAENKLLTWARRLKNGQPTVSMTLFDSITNEKIGYIEVCVGNSRGTAELGYCLTSEAWEMYAENIFQTMVNQWAPEVNRIGRGVGLCDGQKNIEEAFQCLIGSETNKGSPLRCVDTFASLAYPRSWEIFDRSGFSSPSVSSENASTFADFQREGMCNKCGLHTSEGPWRNDKAGVCIKEDDGVCKQEEGLSTKEKDLLYTQRLEEEIIRRFYSSQETGLTPGVQYFLVDPDGRLRTFSRHRVTSHICYHFMYAYQS